MSNLQVILVNILDEIIHLEKESYKKRDPNEIIGGTTGLVGPEITIRVKDVSAEEFVKYTVLLRNSINDMNRNDTRNEILDDAANIINDSPFSTAIISTMFEGETIPEELAKLLSIKR